MCMFVHEREGKKESGREEMPLFCHLITSFGCTCLFRWKMEPVMSMKIASPARAIARAPAAFVPQKSA